MTAGRCIRVRAMNSGFTLRGVALAIAAAACLAFVLLALRSNAPALSSVQATQSMQTPAAADAEAPSKEVAASPQPSAVVPDAAASVPTREVATPEGPATHVRILVVDSNDTRVAGARVRVLDPTTQVAFADSETNAAGEVDLLTPNWISIEANKGEGHAALRFIDLSRAPAGTRVFTLVLARAGSIEGSLGGAVPRSIGVRLISTAIGSPYALRGVATIAETAAENGHFRFGDLAPGFYGLVLDPKGNRHFQLPHAAPWPSENNVAPVVVEVKPAETTTLALDLVEGGVLSGTVRDESGAPVRDAAVSVVLASEHPNLGDMRVDGVFIGSSGSSDWGDWGSPQFVLHPEIHRSGRTDANGRFGFLGLQTGRHRVEVVAKGFAFERREDVLVSAMPSTLDLIVKIGGFVDVIAQEGRLIAFTMTGESKPRVIVRSPRGAGFNLPSLPAGELVATLLHGYSLEGATELARTRVIAHQRTLLDLTRTGVPVHLRVVSRGLPVTNARVVHAGISSVTDRDGRVDLFADVEDGPQEAIEVDAFGVRRLGLDAFSAVGDSETSKTIDLGSNALTIATLDAKGHPVAATLARLTLYPAQDPVGATHSWAIDATELRLEGPEPRRLLGLPDGQYTIEIRFESGAIVTTSLALDGDRTVTATEPGVGDIRVKVIDRTRRAVADQRVIASTAFGTKDLCQVEGKTDADGMVLLRGVRIGSVRVQVVPWMFSSEEPPERFADFREVDLGLRETKDVTLTLEAR